jgi:hypothetical protein
MQSTCSGGNAHVSPATRVDWPWDGLPGGGLTIQDMEWVPCLRSKASSMYYIGISSVLTVVRAADIYEDRQFLPLSGGKQIIQASIAKQKAKIPTNYEDLPDHICCPPRPSLGPECRRAQPLCHLCVCAVVPLRWQRSRPSHYRSQGGNFLREI